MVREVCHEFAIGIRIAGKIVNILRYADDKTVVASSQKGLQELMNRRNAVTKEYGMRIIVKKTKVTCIPWKAKSKVRLLIDDQQVEQVNQFKYLGSWITDDIYVTRS